MVRVPVRSTNVASVGYDADKQILEIEYREGGVYQYLQVPVSTYEALMSAESKGQHLHKHIKGSHPYKRHL